MWAERPTVVVATGVALGNYRGVFVIVDTDDESDNFVVEAATIVSHTAAVSQRASGVDTDQAKSRVVSASLGLRL